MEKWVSKTALKSNLGKLLISCFKNSLIYFSNIFFITYVKESCENICLNEFKRTFKISTK